jgi:hypothetical protein
MESDKNSRGFVKSQFALKYHIKWFFMLKAFVAIIILCLTCFFILHFTGLMNVISPPPKKKILGGVLLIYSSFVTIIILCLTFFFILQFTGLMFITPRSHTHYTHRIKCFGGVIVSVLFLSAVRSWVRSWVRSNQRL